MNIKRKLEIAKRAIDSIGSHADIDSLVRKSAFDSLRKHLDDWNTLTDAHNSRLVESQMPDAENDSIEQ